MRIMICLTNILIVAVLMTSCGSIRTSHYAAYNQFRYGSEQPRFHFSNDTLKIEGAWSWANEARAIPKLSYIPKNVRKTLEPIAKEKGYVLFATWTPNRKKFRNEGYVQVTKDDVRYVDENNQQFFVTVLVNDQEFKTDTSVYKFRGVNYDTKFQIYTSKPKLAASGYWVMEVIAASEKRYYDFVCITDESFMESKETREYQASVFLEDIQHQFVGQ
ncbi:hypothetical protein [Pinibacter aurantiacus]|uniref:Uncharacterized protein n=1 Tax=Pinibacter aurantiacus TaxID=2851599 RepID=A0A9E2W471_9BACT|nr:hypothetical protein [Pinibacter aurantiacus]MBV4357559.1 hypothetical protein [Pinibacter aurantiacus]